MVLKMSTEGQEDNDGVTSGGLHVSARPHRTIASAAAPAAAEWHDGISGMCGRVPRRRMLLPGRLIRADPHGARLAQTRSAIGLPPPDSATPPALLPRLCGSRICSPTHPSTLWTLDCDVQHTPAGLLREYHSTRQLDTPVFRSISMACLHTCSTRVICLTSPPMSRLSLPRAIVHPSTTALHGATGTPHRADGSPPAHRFVSLSLSSRKTLLYLDLSRRQHTPTVETPLLGSLITIIVFLIASLVPHRKLAVPLLYVLAVDDKHRDGPAEERA